MNFLTFLEAAIKLGIPMVVLSWLIFTWLYGGGDLDREADRKSINSHAKKMKMSRRGRKSGGRADYLLGKWMWFGSGFYGLAALWTFVVIEIADIVRLLMNPSTVVGILDAGFVSAAIDLLMNQIRNIVTAFVWFGYWADEGIVVWLLVAYLGYWLGVELARRGDDLPMQGWLQKLKSLRP